MKKILGFELDLLEKKNSRATLEEIYQQPNVWLKTYKKFVENKQEIQTFLREYDANKKARIIFTGAGSSDYVGKIAAIWLTEKLNRKIESIATTDIVASPHQFLSIDEPTILVSFGRSGNSPESIAAYALVEQCITNCAHIIITCNRDGALANCGRDSKQSLVLHLPPETHDLGFAMTSSFSTMLLAGLLTFQIDQIEQIEAEVLALCESVQQGMELSFEQIEIIASEPFKRIVYLGSGELTGVAQECSLKVLELTAGQVSATFETPMGFRHGPKSIVNKETVIVLCMSMMPYTQKYELDVLKEIGRERQGNKIITLTMYPIQEVRDCSDDVFVFGKSEDCFRFIPIQAFSYVVWGQLFSYYAAMKKGITVDNPCVTGEVNRVVKGVKIYSYHE